MAKKPTTTTRKTTTTKKTTATKKKTTTANKKPKTAPQSRTVQKASPKDAEQNKGMAIVAYILFFIPLITGDHKKSPFVKFHTNQGTVLFIVSVAVSIVLSIIWAILGAIFGSLSVSSLVRDLYSAMRRANAALVLAQISAVVWWIFALLTLALFIIGIINAANGRMKPLPIIGKFTIIK